MITCNSIKEKYGCSTIENGFEIISDATLEKGGQGLGFRPHNILECAYASCLNMFARMQCDKLRIPYDKITVKVDLQRTESKTTFKYSVQFDKEISENQRDLIIEAPKGSPIRKTLSKPIDFELDLTL